jgi:hypothetical protein
MVRKWSTVPISLSYTTPHQAKRAVLAEAAAAVTEALAAASTRLRAAAARCVSKRFKGLRALTDGLNRDT